MDQNCLCLELKLGLQHQPRLQWASGLTGVHPVCSTPTICIRNVSRQSPPNVLKNNIYWIPISNTLSYRFQLWIPHLTLTQYLLSNFSSHCNNCSSYCNLGKSSTSTRSHAVLLLKKKKKINQKLHWLNARVLNLYHQILGRISCYLWKQMCVLLLSFITTPHVPVKMAAKVKFHSGSDAVKEHLHSLDP